MWRDGPQRDLPCGESTGDMQPGDWANDRGTVRFIYGGKYYWAYESNIRNPKDGPQMYGPYDLP